MEHSCVDHKIIDKVGIVASVGCLIHCLIFSLLPVLPVVGLTTEHGPLFHIVMGGLVTAFVFRATYYGMKKHNSVSPMILGFCGMLGIFLGAVFEVIGLPFSSVPTVIGSLYVIGAHITNYRLSCKCGHHGKLCH